MTVDDLVEVFGARANYIHWKLTLELVAVPMTVPLWHQAGLPRAMCERPARLQTAARELLVGLRGLAEQAGAREQAGDPNVRPWYMAAIQGLIESAFDDLARHYGTEATYSLAAWVVTTDMEQEPYEWGRTRSLAFARIADGRPSDEVVAAHVSERALQLIRAAFGPGADEALDECVREAENTTATEADLELTAYDPVALRPGESPYHDVVGEMRQAAEYVRARSLREVLSRVLPADEWARLDAQLDDWPW